LGFTVAVGRYEKGQTETSFFDCVQWGKTAESLAKHMTKGRLVAVKGEMRQNRWTDREGAKRSQILLVADTYGGVQLLANNSRSSEDSAPAIVDRGYDADSFESFDDDIPF
jgi:single-strand DNA-binding protein